jgi:hypothetical protein
MEMAAATTTTFHATINIIMATVVLLPRQLQSRYHYLRQ